MDSEGEGSARCQPHSSLPDTENQYVHKEHHTVWFLLLFKATGARPSLHYTYMTLLVSSQLNKTEDFLATLYRAWLKSMTEANISEALEALDFTPSHLRGFFISVIHLCCLRAL